MVTSDNERERIDIDSEGGELGVHSVLSASNWTDSPVYLQLSECVAIRI